MTYALLMGLRGGAVADESVEVGRWFEFAADKVPELAKDIGGVQRPVVATPKGGQSFPLARITAEDRGNIRLQPAKPMFVQCKLAEGTDGDDLIGVGKAVDEALWAEAGRGRAAGLSFVEAKEMADSYLLVGLYRVEGDAVTVTVGVKAGATRVAQLPPLTGDKTKLAELAAAVVAEARKAVEAGPKK